MTAHFISSHCQSEGPRTILSSGVAHDLHVSAAQTGSSHNQLFILLWLKRHKYACLSLLTFTGCCSGNKGATTEPPRPNGAESLLVGKGIHVPDNPMEYPAENSSNIYSFICYFLFFFAQCREKTHNQNSRCQVVMEELPGACPAHEPPSSMVLVKETFSISGMKTRLFRVEGRTRGSQGCFPGHFWSVLRTTRCNRWEQEVFVETQFISHFS